MLFEVRVSFTNLYNEKGCRGRMVVGFITTLSVPITTNVVSLNPAHGEVYSIQHYVIKVCQ